MFRFTIRDVLWLMALVAIGLAWWLDHQRLARDLFITVPTEQFRAGLRKAEKVEFEVLPNGNIGSRIIPAKPDEN